jgi:hypothetical protein
MVRRETARTRPDEPLSPCVEVVSDSMAEVFRGMTGAERLRVSSRMFTSARHMLINHLRASHPDWDERRVVQEAAHRLSHGAL